MSPPTETEVHETTALLIRARGFIERGWCRGHHALDADGYSVDPNSADVKAWCVAGALIAAGCQNTFNPAVQRFRNATGGDEMIWQFNGRQETVEPVLAAFDRAIADEPR